MKIIIRRCKGNRDAWGAFVGPNDFIVATSYSLDTLATIIAERHGGGPLNVTLELSEDHR